MTIPAKEDTLVRFDRCLSERTGHPLSAQGELLRSSDRRDGSEVRPEWRSYPHRTQRPPARSISLRFTRRRHALTDAFLHLLHLKFPSGRRKNSTSPCTGQVKTTRDLPSWIAAFDSRSRVIRSGLDVELPEPITDRRIATTKMRSRLANRGSRSDELPQLFSINLLVGSVMVMTDRDEPMLLQVVAHRGWVTADPSPNLVQREALLQI